MRSKSRNSRHEKPEHKSNSVHADTMSAGSENSNTSGCVRLSSMDPHEVLTNAVNENRLSNRGFKTMLQSAEESAIVRSTTNYNLNSQRRVLDDSSMTMQRFVADLTGNDAMTGTVC